MIIDGAIFKFAYLNIMSDIFQLFCRPYILFQEMFFKARPHLRSLTNYGSIEERVQLRNRLKCQSFDWYLRNVYPELFPNHAQPPNQPYFSAMPVVTEKSTVEKYQVHYHVI